jgi:hypothetical protein
MVPTFSDALTPMEMDGTEDQLPSEVTNTAKTSQAKPERIMVDL